MARVHFYLATAMLTILAVKGTATAQYDWTGWYVGVNSGGTWSDSDVSTRTVFHDASFTGPGYFQPASVNQINSLGKGSVNSAGFTGGMQGGFNWQIGNFVLGLETDLDYLGQDDTRTIGPVTYPNFTRQYIFSQKLKTDNLFTLRPRVGWAANNFLLYGTGGLAVSGIRSSFQFRDFLAIVPGFGAVANGSKNETKAGWIVGGGLEYGLAANWTIRGEYMYTRFSNIRSTDTLIFNLPFKTNPFIHKNDLGANIVRLGLNFKF